MYCVANTAFKATGKWDLPLKEDSSLNCVKLNCDKALKFVNNLENLLPVLLEHVSKNDRDD